MKARKAFFEKNLTFSACLPAVGQNHRQSWGPLCQNRSHKIRELKKQNPSWQNVVTDQIKIALQCRKIRTFECDLEDINKLLQFELNLYPSDEIAWIKKIRRSLIKNIKRWRKENLLLTVTLNEGKVN